MVGTAVAKGLSGVGCALVLLAGLAGCGSAPGGESNEENVGAVELAITQGPPDAKCLRLTVDNALTEQTVLRNFALTPGQSSKFAVTGLPLGSVGFLGEAFNVACSAITATTPFTWTSTRVVVTLSPNSIPSLNLPLQKAGRVNVGVDFVSGLQFEDVLLPAPAVKVAASTNGSVVISVPADGSVWRASNGTDAALLAKVVGSPRFIAAAPNGNILVTSTGTVDPVNRVSVLTAAGALKSTIPLPFGASDLALDTAGNAWLGSNQSANVQYVSKVLTAPVVSLLPLPQGVPGSGVWTTSDGARAISSAGFITRYTTAGVPIDTTPCPAGARDLTLDASGNTWIFSTTLGLTLRMSPDGVTNVPPPLGGPFGETTIFNSAKGVLLATGGPFFVLFPPGVPFGQRIDVPNVTAISGLTVDTLGRVWVADNAQPRMVIVTLP